MPEIELWKVFASLGIPGLALGVFYMLSRQFKWKFPQVPRIWVGPIIILFIISVSGITLYALTLWAPTFDKNKSSVQNHMQTKGNQSPAIKTDKGDVTIKYGGTE